MRRLREIFFFLTLFLSCGLCTSWLCHTWPPTANLEGTDASRRAKSPFVTACDIPVKDCRPSEICDSLYAVHAMDALPREGQLRAGNRYGFCLTVHFALGEVVRPLKGYSWNHCLYAVVVPLRRLLPQLINLNCYDTYIIGDLDLDESCTLVLPAKDVSQLSPSRLYAVWPYDPETMTLREAVDDLIRHKGGWTVSMHPQADERCLPEAILKSTGENINKADFFAPLTSRYPHIGVGLRFGQWDGQGYLFHDLEAKMTKACCCLAVDGEATDPLALLPSEIMVTLTAMDRLIEGPPFPLHVKLQYQQIRYEALGWVHLLAAEAHLNRVHSKTLRGVGLKRLSQIFPHRHNPYALHDYLQGIVEELPTQRAM